MSKAASNDGQMVEVEDLIVEGVRIYSFVERNRKEYFEDHGLEWCLDEIISRGMAEITRQIKTAKTQAQQRAAGKLMQEYNLTPEMAKQILRDAIAKATVEAQAKAAQSK